MTFSRSETGLRRLHRQGIAHRTFKDASEVITWLGAMQGQDYAGAKWAFGIRLPGLTEADIDTAIASGQIMRTWAVRGTLHYVSPADIHWMVGLIAPKQISGNAARYRELELDESTLIRSTAIIAHALENGEYLTRSALFAILETSGITTTGQRGFYMLQRAGLERLVYQGAMHGSETTFRALPAGKSRPKEEALAELARRYFLSRGPATLADFTHWSGLLISEARAGLESIKSLLVEDIIDGQSYWLTPDTYNPPTQSLHLLPGFDEYILGYRDRSAVLAPEYADAICPGGNGVFISTLVSDGRVIGTWKRTLKKKTVSLAISPFRPLTDAESDLLTAQSARYGAFLGLTASVQG